MASVPSFPTYTPSARHAVGDPRWIVLYGSLRGKPVSHLRAMAESSFDRLDADLGHDPDFPMTRAALENVFYWLFVIEDGLLMLPGDSLLMQLTIGILIGGVPQAERAVAALRVGFGSGLVRTLENRQQVLDHAVTMLYEELYRALAGACITRT
ncbi:hypothetical protein LIER_28612 [Lithospermum erythrorhizon]|uniref:Uncharacterized protein n=1 Tax=Lithospermum erythrorhizon TaxID=34254 RepID=A0AAV3RKG2_LITER